MTTPTPEETSLTTTAQSTFAAYNAGGPPERANLTWDDKPVPPWQSLSASVQHKWMCATSAAALAGAAFVIGLLKDGPADLPGPADLDRVLAQAEMVFGRTPWGPPGTAR